MKRIVVLAIASLVAINLQAEKVTYTNMSKEYTIELQVQPKVNEQIISYKLEPQTSLTKDIPGRTIDKLTFVEYNKDGSKNKVQVWSRDNSKQNRIMNMDEVNRYEVSRSRSFTNPLADFELKGY